jgi:hypothetical protein
MAAFRVLEPLAFRDQRHRAGRHMDFKQIPVDGDGASMSQRPFPGADP